MLHDFRLEGEFFARLEQADRRLASWVKEKRCPHCGGPLHVGNYGRKARGGRLAEVGEVFRVRYSLCCGREGCRRRVLPPSLRFLGRRVYVELVVLLASVEVLLQETLAVASQLVGVPSRTLKRWGLWWREQLPTSMAWLEIQARVIPAPQPEWLPRSLYERIREMLSRSGRKHAKSDVCLIAAQLLASCTTQSLPDASRLMRELEAGWLGE
jgi:hypothetical protein